MIIIFLIVFSKTFVVRGEQLLGVTYHLTSIVSCCLFFIPVFDEISKRSLFLLILVFFGVIIFYVVLLCTALFMVNIIRLLVEFLGFVVVVSVGSWKMFC